MKKLGLYALALASLVTVGGCSKKEEESSIIGDYVVSYVKTEVPGNPEMSRVIEGCPSVCVQDFPEIHSLSCNYNPSISVNDFFFHASIIKISNVEYFVDGEGAIYLKLENHHDYYTKSSFTYKDDGKIYLQDEGETRSGDEYTYTIVFEKRK